MALNSFTSGVNTDFSDELNENSAAYITQSGLNAIRQLRTNNSISLSQGQMEGFVEGFSQGESVRGTLQSQNNIAYVAPDNDRNNGSLVIGIEDEAQSDTTTSNNVSNAPNAFDNDSSTFTDIFDDGYVGKTFSSKMVTDFYLDLYLFYDDNDAGQISGSSAVYVQTYDGSSWNTELQIGGGAIGTFTKTRSKIIQLNKSIQGIRVYSASVDQTKQVELYSLGYTTTGYAESGELIHNISSGTFSDNISKAIGVPFIKVWNSNSQIKYELSNNSGDSTGVLPANNNPQLSSFQPFDTEPSTLTIQLSDTSTTPSLEIGGFYVKAD